MTHLRLLLLLLFFSLIDSVKIRLHEIDAPPPKIASFKFGPPSEKYNGASWTPGLTNVLKSDRLTYADAGRHIFKRRGVVRGNLVRRYAPEIFRKHTDPAYDSWANYYDRLAKLPSTYNLDKPLPLPFFPILPWTEKKAGFPGPGPDGKVYTRVADPVKLEFQSNAELMRNMQYFNDRRKLHEQWWKYMGMIPSDMLKDDYNGKAQQPVFAELSDSTYPPSSTDSASSSAFPYAPPPGSSDTDIPPVPPSIPTSLLARPISPALLEAMEQQSQQDASFNQPPPNEKPADLLAEKIDRESSGFLPAKLRPEVSVVMHPQSLPTSSRIAPVSSSPF